jgi:hypothetical protein
MKDANGDEFPDPPMDEEERREWKTFYHIRLYGASKEQIAQFMSTHAEQLPKIEVQDVTDRAWRPARKTPPWERIP